MSFGAVAGATIGAVGSIAGAKASKKGGGGTQTVDKSPWQPAEPWLLSNIATGQELQDYYKNNPFNQQQQEAYNNIFSDLNMFRSQIAPGLFGKANEMMGYNYQRRSFDRPGLVGYSPQGLLQQPVQSQQVFGKPQVNPVGLLDFAPKQAEQQPAPAFDQNTIAEMVKAELLRAEEEERQYALANSAWGGAWGGY